MEETAKKLPAKQLSLPERKYPGSTSFRGTESECGLLNPAAFAQRLDPNIPRSSTAGPLAASQRLESSGLLI